MFRSTQILSLCRALSVLQRGMNSVRQLWLRAPVGRCGHLIMVAWVMVCGYIWLLRRVAQ